MSLLKMWLFFPFFFPYKIFATGLGEHFALPLQFKTLENLKVL